VNATRCDLPADYLYGDVIKSHFGGDRIGQHRAEYAAITGLNRIGAIAILRVA
jgi:hypothetical protein